MTKLLHFFILSTCFASISLNSYSAANQPEEISLPSSQVEVDLVFNYFINQVEEDTLLSHQEQHDKIDEFKTIIQSLSPEAAYSLTNLLIEETRSRIFEMLQHAELNQMEINEHLTEYDKAISNVENIDAEIAREMLFFVAELKIHRQYVYDFGIALGCPSKQLLRHDLCKLDARQFEGYARYFRGGKQDQDKQGYLDAWGLHQYEEHHHQSYSKEGFNFDNFTEERVKNNMLETVADLLAANIQRGGGTLLNYLINIFPLQDPHPRLIPYLEEALKKAQFFHLDANENPHSEYSLFKDLPSWNEEVENIFNKLKKSKHTPSNNQSAFEEKSSTTSFPVGELGEAWQFPSDHLPIGASIGNIHFSLWNTLNKDYLHWIEENSQGLKNSLIMKTNVSLNDHSSITLREQMIINHVLQMLNHPTHPRSIVALQEVGKDLFRELASILPDHMSIYPHNGDQKGIEDIFIVNNQIFEILDFEVSHYTFSKNTILKLIVNEITTGIKYNFIQSHVPGGPVNSLPARIELAEKVMQNYNPNMISIVFGDMNRSPDFFYPQFKNAAKKAGLHSQPFTDLTIPYPTHINTHKEASWIDNLFIANPYDSLETHVSNNGSEFFDDLQPTLDLLEKLKL